MRRTLIVASLALAGSLIAATSVAAATTSSARASLEIVSVDPLRVAGAGFKPYERVRVAAWVDGNRTTARTRAGRRGAFALRMVDSTSGMCGSFTLVAVGNRGSRATIALNNIMCTPTR